MIQTSFKLSPISQHMSFFYILNMDFSISSHVAIMTDTEVHTHSIPYHFHTAFSQFLNQMQFSSGQLLASHRGDPGSCPGRACGVCSGQSGTGAGFLQVLWFPLPIIPPISPSS
jgi:hypothetical protein